MKKIIFTLFMLPFATNLIAQEKTKIFGTVVDSLSTKGIEFATVIISDSVKQVSAVVAGGNGKFTIETKRKGDLKLIFTAVGYRDVTMPLRIDSTQTKLDVGVIALSQGVAIEEVTIKAQKPLIKIDADKLTYSVESDPESATATVAEILRKIPQLSVDAEDNVLLNGQSNYKVLVNGKSSGLMSKNFKEVIKSMPANTIKDIEVITNPSTKYDAEGVGGVINIITTRDSIAGYNGRVSANVGSFDSYGGSAYVALQAGKFNLSAQYWGSFRGSPDSKYRSERTNLNNDDFHKVISEYDNKNSSRYNNQGLTIEASYDIDSLNLITMSVWGGIYSGKSESNMGNWIENKVGDTVQEFINANNSNNKDNYLSGSIDYQRLFKKPDRTLTVSYNLETNPSKNNTDYQIKEILNYPSYHQKSTNISNGTEHTLQVDYYDPLNKNHQIEVGLKYILRLNDSDSEILSSVDGEVWEDDNERKNDLDHNQSILGMYAGYVFKHKDFTFKAGGRLEHTINSGWSKSIEGTTPFDNNLFNVVPYVNLSYRIKPTQTARLSYTQRLRRPSIWYLNPYVDDSNPLAISYGNPDLKSVVSHTINGQYSIFGTSWNLFVGLNGALTDNNIVEYTTVNDEGISERTYENLGTKMDYGSNISFSYRYKTIFNVYVGGSARYSMLESKELGLKNDGWAFNAHGGLNVTTWKGGSVGFWGGAYSSTVTLQGSSSANIYTSFNIRQKFFKQKLEVGLSVQDPFSKYKVVTTEASDPTFSSFTRSEYVTRRVSISVSFRFGKIETRVKKARRSIQNEDSMGGGGGSQGQGDSSGGGQ